MRRIHSMTRHRFLLGLLFLGWAAGTYAADDKKDGITVDAEKRSVAIDAKIAPRKLEHLKGEVYPIEVIASWPHPRGKKAHETVVTIEAKPSDIHKALEGLGLKAGA